MATVYELRDHDGICWGVFPNEEDARNEIPLLLDAPKSVRVTTGEMLDAEFVERFEPHRRPKPHVPFRKGPGRPAKNA